MIQGAAACRSRFGTRALAFQLSVRAVRRVMHNVRMKLNMHAGARLVTQQLVYSALLTQHRGIPLTAVEIIDLASLIDVYCLFDKAHVLDRAWNVLDTEGSGSELGEMLSEFVVVDRVEWADTEKLRRVVQAHMSTVTAALDTAGSRRAGTRSGGDYSDEDDAFDERGFVYLAYADIQQVPFTPDFTRAAQIQQLTRAEDSFAGELLSNLRAQYPQWAGRRSASVTQRVSPVAGAVLDRAVRNQRGIAREMRILRDELAPLRARLNEAEQKLICGSYAEAQKAEKKWRKVLEELRLTFGDHPNLIEIGNVLSYGDVVGELVDEPASARSWLSAVATLPIEIANRILRRRPIIEIHRLRSDIPAGGRLGKCVETLFGVRL
ncbi:MAG TPA: hypothetical protein VF432_24945 [Thermoanaerobaculia bacterium]